MMSDDLLQHYNSELRFIRRMGQMFAKDHPKIAGRLGIVEDHVEDPHVSRLIEAFAYLNARTQKKIEDDFPEIAEAYLNVMYPHYLNPLPSMAIARFSLAAAQGELTEGQLIPAGTELETPPIDGEPYRFRTAYPVQLWPVDVVDARLQSGLFRAPESGWTRAAKSVLHIHLRTMVETVSISAMKIASLRFFLQAGVTESNKLIEVFFRKALGVAVATSPTDPSPVFLEADCLQPVGLASDEGLLPYTARSFVGYRLLTEYFAYPRKFHFVDVDLSQLNRTKFGRDLHLFIYLRDEESELVTAVDKRTFVQGASPAVNLFRLSAEPRKLDHGEYEHPIVPDRSRRNSLEVYSVEKVVATTRRSQKEYHPFYSALHSEDEAKNQAFWYTSRRRRSDGPGTDMWLSLVDLDFRPQAMQDVTLRVDTVCTNMNLPRRLMFDGGIAMQFSGSEGGLATCSLISRPTESYAPTLGHGVRWRLISHLTLNGLSLDQHNVEGLREMLRMYDFVNNAVTQQVISGLSGVRYRRGSARVRESLGNRTQLFACRGIDVDVLLTPSAFTDGGMFLFGQILERFLGLYCNMNSFVRTRVVNADNESVYHQWPPRSGDQVVL